jgi:hypothetical protein
MEQKSNKHQEGFSEVGMKVVEFATTPNPNALKCVLDTTVSQKARSYFNPAAAAGDDLARKLFEVPGVTNVLILGDWFTVSKEPSASWASVKAGVKRVVEGIAE